MLRLKEGDRVRVVDRVPTPADTKRGLFYGYYRGLTGIVFHIYGTGETAQVALEADLDALPTEILQRHLDCQERMRASLPPDARRASAAGGPNEFRLRYVVLVSLSDIERWNAKASKTSQKETRLPSLSPSSTPISSPRALRAAKS